MTAPDSPRSPRTGFYLWPLSVLFLCLMPWIGMEYDKSINPDIFWLTTGVSRLLHGATMTNGVYDTNPPLSILVYVPLYFLSLATGMSFAASATLTTMIYTALSAAAVFLLARRIVDDGSALMLAASFALAGTILAAAAFGQRDQLVALSLLPFVLGQAVITLRIPCAKALLWPVLIAGAILILLKPPFGLLPAVFLIHRAVVQKRWSVVGDADFVALAGAAVLYAATVWMFFSDFAVNILPDVIRLYVGNGDWALVAKNMAAYAVFYLAVWSLCIRVEKTAGNRRWLMNALFACAVLSLIPFAVQGRGFHYHLIPSLTFFWTAAGFSLFPAAQRIFSHSAAAVAAILVLAAAGYMIEPPSSYISKRHVESLPLTTLVRDCGADCRFVLFTTDIGAVQMTGYYSGKDNASRFPSLWFLPELLKKENLLDGGSAAKIDEGQYERYFHKYARYLAEDIQKGKRSLVISCPQDFDYIRYFSQDAGFASAWRAYAPAGKVRVNFSDYYPPSFHARFPAMDCGVFRRI